MGLFELALIAAAFLLLDGFALVYRWIRDQLGEPEPEPIPAARLTRHGQHRGYRREPTWLRPFQAMLLTCGLMAAFAAALSFLGVAGAMLFV